MKNDQNVRKFCRRFFLSKMYKNMQKRVTFWSQFLSMVEIIIITFIYMKLYALSNKELGFGENKASLKNFEIFMVITNPSKIYLFKVNIRSTRKWCEICSK